MKSGPPRWYRPRSLRGKLLIWLVPLYLVMALLSGVASCFRYEALIHRFMDELMETLAYSHAAGRIEDIAPLPVVSWRSAHENGAVIVQLWTQDGRLITSSRFDAAVSLQATPGHHVVADEQDKDQVWRVFTAPPGIRASQPRVQVLQSERFTKKEVARRAFFAAAPVALLVPVTLLVLWLVVARTSRSLRTVADDVARRDDGNLDEIPASQVPEELAPLVGAFNTLLARLQRAFVAQCRFVQDAAHELRTPMTAVALQMENLRACVPDGQARDQLAQLEAGMHRAHHLVEQLLRLSRQDVPATPPPTDPVDLTALLRESVGQCMALADRRRIEVGFDGQVAPVFRASVSDLRSVFDNLLDNALRYTPEGGEIEVRVHTADGRAVVDVVDSGPGLPHHMLERVFDRFFRMPGAPSGGSGLGLAITRAAALRQGLSVELRARDDGVPGLVARVHLPG
ncbi:HAMP domain-containing sensor histidine kinase [Rhizobacter sp. Root1221]|uniref:sensor histidine kinase n=1 Tax=Rhizobacter sp. Root1221 TaxID=1736433 RepID=UPI001F478346|nr:ATP-binding protein [Rhizobacter sp. Root1221]